MPQLATPNQCAEAIISAVAVSSSPTSQIVGSGTCGPACTWLLSRRCAAATVPATVPRSVPGGLWQVGHLLESHDTLPMYGR